MTSHRDKQMAHDRRKNFPLEWNCLATIHDSERHLARPCILSSFSNGGAQITGVRAGTIPDEFVLQITRDDGRVCRVIWRTDDVLGVEFIKHVTLANEPKPVRKTQEAVE
jgi:hypothetical protein